MNGDRFVGSKILSNDGKPEGGTFRAGTAILPAVVSTTASVPSSIPNASSDMTSVVAFQRVATKRAFTHVPQRINQQLARTADNLSTIESTGYAVKPCASSIGTLLHRGLEQ